MKYSSLMFLSLALTCVQCSEKSDPVPVSKTALSLSVDPQYPTTESDNWVIIHSTDGKLIGYKAFESGDNVTIETMDELPGGEVNVTLFRMRPWSDQDDYSLQSYLHVTAGQEWTLKPLSSTYEPGNQIGEFHFELTGLQDDHVVAFSDKDGHSGNSSYSGGTNTYLGAGPIYDNAPDYFLFVMDHIGKPRYKWFRDVADQDSYKLSVSEMNEFDHEVEVNFPLTDKFTYHIAGAEVSQDEYYWVCSNLNHVNMYSRNSLKLGYNNNFVKYSTWLRVNYDHRSIEYNKVGARPSSITLPLNAEFTTVDKSLAHFTYTQNQPFVIRRSIWTFSNTGSTPKLWASWEVISPEGSQTLTEWPDELTTKYADFSLDKMVYRSTSFFTESPSFQDQLNAIFKGAAYPDIASISVIVN